ncbi:inositol 2-dehydrogenase [Phototrophicus methaneseepsis]|uniref:Inositol 2-dehydrogenase n=1 Tax=Phototrophicus methaneseepsis TaxID=2710758 RepID=A0A7S8E6R4_9CHLR|nr:inositol 2-dehydrogenase [Phototrophicus methaneseepsis]QPC81365.1 inositol 2-dehydrogenase [Phototrophicus methaneseepsis]
MSTTNPHTNSKIKVAVIGLGRMGQVYGTHVARQIDGASLVAVCDMRPEVTGLFADQFNGVRVYPTVAALLEQRDIDAVIVATPTSTHREVVIAAAEAGKAIFCEKPTALTLAATDEMIHAVEKAGVLFQVGFMRRFDKGYAAARARIEAGEIGQPVMIRSVGRDPFPTSLDYANPAMSGGLIIDMGIHDFDAVRWLMQSDIARVYTEATSLVYPELQTVGDVDTAVISLRFANEAVGNVEVSRTAIYGYDIQCEIVGTEGTLHIGYLRETPLLLMNKAGVHHDVVPHFPERFGPAYTAQIEHFVECLRQGKAPIVTPQDARAALQASVAATISQHEGRIVYVDDVR